MGAKTVRDVLGSVALTLPMMIAAGAQAQQASPAAVQDASASSVEDIIVTASKRSESLRDVPSAISVLSAEALERRGIERFSDYVRAVPGLSAIDASAPGRGQAVIRGITSGVKQNAPTVTFYLDDIPLTASSPLAISGTNIFDPDLADVARVEVLKGPQSTLYGASAMGGLIRIITVDPSFDGVSGSFRIDGGKIEGGGATYGGRASVNLPLIEDRLALRLSAYSRRDGGFVDNARYDQEDVNEATSSGLRAAVRARLSDGLETKFSGLIQDTEGDAYAYETVDPVTLQPVAGEYANTLQYNTAFESRYRAIGNTTALETGFGTISNSLSYTTTYDYFLRDYSNQYFPFIPAAPAGVGIPGETSSDTSRVTNELRLTSNEGSRLEWLGGLFYTKEKNAYAAHISANDPVTGAVLPLPEGNLYTFDLDATFEEYAAFGDVTYHFTDQFEVTAGLRYSSNEQTFRTTRSGVLGATPIGPRESSDSATTYLLTASYHMTPRATVYARAASAYRPGSTQPVANAAAPAEYGPDTLWNYEVGVKGDWFDGLIGADIAVYRVDWSDIQLNSLVNGFSVISNAGDAESQGIDAAVTLRPADGLTVVASGAYNRATIETSNPSIGAVAGDPLPFSPKFTGALSADYVWPVTTDLDGRFGFSWSYQGSRYTALSGDATNTRYNLPSFATIDLRGGVEWDRYTLSLRVENLTDERAITSAQRVRLNGTQNNPVTATVIRPRTAMLSLGVRF